MRYKKKLKEKKLRYIKPGLKEKSYYIATRIRNLFDDDYNLYLSHNIKEEAS